MIAACPKCSARYRIEKGKLGPEGARLKCSRCEAVFRVRPPEGAAAGKGQGAGAPEPAQAATAARPEPVAPAAVEQVSAVPAARPEVERPVLSSSAAPSPRGEARHDRSRLVLVADPVIEEGKATASALAAWGLQPILVHDGVEAMLTIQRTLPCTAIIDAALPKMYGFQVCEVLKRNESLRGIHVVLVGAIHDRTRYRRTPTELYGADAYLERPQLPDALWPILRQFGLPLAGTAPPPGQTHDLPYPMQRSALEPTPVAPEPAPPEAPAVRPPPPHVETPEVAAASPPPAPGATAVSEAEIAKAERLARIVVSDIILYNQEKFDAAVLAGDVLAALDGELREGRSLFSQRIEAHVRERRDFLADELLRVASLRSRA